MDLDKLKKPAISAAVTIIIGVIVYSLFGILTYANSTVIYDEFPEEFYCDPLDPEQILTIKIKNNAPLSPPFINPFYNVRVIVEAENDAFAYFIGSGNKKCNFTDYSIDIGRIDSGDFEDTDIYLHVDEGNLTLRIDIYLSFWFKIKAAHATYFIEYQGDYKYTVRKTD